LILFFVSKIISAHYLKRRKRRKSTKIKKIKKIKSTIEKEEVVGGMHQAYLDKGESNN
jgi:uncharacterized membrane protein affecting hemolysin expression